MKLEEPDDNVLKELGDVFKDDVGRRIFAHLLRQYIVDVQVSSKTGER
jgi:hypothetical protein